MPARGPRQTQASITVASTTQQSCIIRADSVANIRRKGQDAQIVQATVGLLQKLEASTPLAKSDHIGR